MKVNALFAQSKFELQQGDDASLQQSQFLLKLDQFHIFATCMICEDSIFKEITKAMATHKISNEINVRLDHLKFEHNSYIETMFYMSVKDGLVRVLHKCHNDPLTGHFGVTKTLELVSRGYWWPQPLSWRFSAMSGNPGKTSKSTLCNECTCMQGMEMGRYAWEVVPHCKALSSLVYKRWEGPLVKGLPILSR